MYTATMEYSFKPERLADAVLLWKEEVMNHAVAQPGFVRMQFLTQDGGQCLALGTWEKKEDAEAFMRTGVFKKLMDKLTGLTTAEPKPRIWDLVHYAGRS